MTTETITIYMPLLNEGTDVWRPVTTERLRHNNTFRIVGPQSAGEEWAFAAGRVVAGEPHRFDDGTHGIAAAALPLIARRGVHHCAPLHLMRHGGPDGGSAWGGIEAAVEHLRWRAVAQAPTRCSVEPVSQCLQAVSRQATARPLSASQLASSYVTCGRVRMWYIRHLGMWSHSGRLP